MSTNQSYTERLYQVVRAPVISEKSTQIADKHEQIMFKVATDATKQEIKDAVELLFKVKVASVQVSNLKGKAKKFGKFMGKRNDVKRAFVCLQPGQEINLATEVN